jgi:hypothetical protein
MKKLALACKFRALFIEAKNCKAITSLAKSALPCQWLRSSNRVLSNASLPLILTVEDKV